MRCLNPAVAALAALAMFAPSVMFGQAEPVGLTVVNYQLVSEMRLTRSQWFSTYSATLSNTGAPLLGVTATVTTLASNVQVIPGQGTLHFRPVGANSLTPSSDTFTILVDRNVPFDLANLKWSFLNPVANAGPNQTAGVGSTITLNGSASSNPSGVGALSYSWSLAARPLGSNATVTNAGGVMASFVVDVPGNYVVSLTVGNGPKSDTAAMTVSTVNSAPVARAGPNQTAGVGAGVTLNGSASSDVDGDPLTYFWTLASRPAASAAFIGNYRSVTANFIADKPGLYIVQLVVNDGKTDSAASTVLVSSGASNTPPVANAGPDRVLNAGSAVQLTGAGSTDVDGNPLTYNWSLITVPGGSTAHLNNPTIVNPTLMADLAGTYVVQLIVNDGTVDSAPSTVTITTNATSTPTANAGPNQTVARDAVVTLSGSGSDPQLLPLTFAWSLINKPAGSTAVLSSSTAAHPTFVADKFGAYIVQLIVNNGTVSSAPSTVTVNTNNTVPVADAGPAQTVNLGATVVLNGGNSSDADHDPLAFAWSFTSRPAGSSAELLATASTSTVFIADAVGTYVAQLIVNDGFTASPPATVTVTVNALQTISLSPASLTLIGTQTQNLTLTLSGPAPTGGLVFNVSSSNPGAATVGSPTVTIPQNTSTASIAVTGVAAGSAVIRATNATVLEAIANVTVNASADIILPAQLTVAPGSSVPFPVSLARPAASSLYVQLTSSDPSVAAISLPGVNFNAGDTQPTRQPTINGVNRGVAGITASVNGLAPATSQVTVGLGVTMSPPNLIVGASGDGTLTLTLSGVTPANVTFTLSSSNPGVATVPQVARVSANASVISFKVTAVAPGSTIIKATALGFPDVTSNVTVQSPGTMTLSAGSTTVQLGQTTTVTVTLSQPAASATTINLTSSNTSRATISPSSILIPLGGTTGSVQVTPVNVGSTTITAAAQGYSSTTLVLQIGATIAWVHPTATITGIGQQIILDLRLFATVPGDNTFSILDGLLINVTSSNPAVAVTPSNVNFFWDGSSVPTVRVQLTSVSPGTTILHASGVNIPDVTMTVTVGSNVASVETSGPASIAVAGGSPQNATVGAAFANPLTVLVKNANNEPLGNIAVGFTAPASGPSGSFAGGAAVAITDANGIAASPVFTANGVKGSYFVTAGVGPLTTSFTLTNTAVPAAQSIDLPKPVSVVPASGIGLTQTFTYTFRDPAGADKLSVLNILINNGLNGAQGCYLAYVPSGLAAGTVLLVNDSGDAGGPYSALAIPGDGSVNNSYCTINGTGSSVSGDGDDLTLNLAVTFSPGFSGNKVIYMAARDTLGKNSGWQALGVWEIPSQPRNGPVVVAMNPARTDNAVSQAYTFTFSDSYGFQDLKILNVLVNNGLDGRNACYIAYAPIDATSGTLYLVGDGGSSSGPFQTLSIPGPGAIRNGQCAINAQGSSASGTGTTLNLTLAISFSDTFAGNQVFYAAARSDRDNSNWQAKGTVTVLGQTLSSGFMTASFTPQSLTLTGTESHSLTLTLSAPAPVGGVTLNLSSSNAGVATVSPSTVTVPANTTNATVQVTGVIAGAAVIRATNANLGAATIADATASITVQPASTDIILPGLMTIRPGDIVNYPVSLASPAGSNGVYVILNSSDPSKVGLTPSNGASVILYFPPGATLPDRRTPSVYGVAYGSAIITASAEGYQSASQTVLVSSTLTFTPQNVVLNGASTQNLTLSLSGAAPPGGLTFNVTSNNPGIASVGAPTVTIPSGATSATVRVTGVSGGFAVVTASAIGVNITATANITVNAAPADIIIPGPLTLAPGQVADFPFSISAPAGPGGVFIVLTSSDPTKVALSPTFGNSVIVFIPEGSTVPDRRPPSVYGVNFGSATITATGDGSQSISQVIQVTASLSFERSSFAINLNGRENRIALNMSAPAPAGGVTIYLSSNNPSVATVPSTVFIPAGATTQTVALMGVSVGSTTIHASAMPNIADVTASVTVAP